MKYEKSEACPGGSCRHCLICSGRLFVTESIYCQGCIGEAAYLNLSVSALQAISKKDLPEAEAAILHLFRIQRRSAAII